MKQKKQIYIRGPRSIVYQLVFVLSGKGPTLIVKVEQQLL